MRAWRVAAAGGAVLATVAALAYLALGPAAAADRYNVIDGDTLELVPSECFLAKLGLGCRAQPLRLYGVDAFESAQRCRDAEGADWACGAVATERLKALVARPGFGCHVDPEFVDRHAREFSVCTVDGVDVGALLVSEGLAFAYGRGAHYLPLEDAAKRDRRGAWAGHFVRPQYFRQGASG